MIAAFVANQMTRYLAGGMKPENAARFTRGELAAIYKGDHWSRDNSGAMRVTPPPENLTLEAAMIKCDEAIAEILNGIKAQASHNMAHNAADKREPSGTAPEAARANRLKGFEELADYRGNYWWERL
jgi:hypothetical protein